MPKLTGRRRSLEVRLTLAGQSHPFHGPPASELTREALEREHAVLTTHNAQLRHDVTALTAEIQRLRQLADRLQRRVAVLASEPEAIGGGR